MVCVVGGEDYRARCGPGIPQPFQGGDAVYPGHLEVEQDHVRPERFGQPHRLRAVRGLADHLEVRLGAEDGDEALAQHRVVVGDQDRILASTLRASPAVR